MAADNLNPAFSTVEPSSPFVVRHRGSVHAMADMSGSERNDDFVAEMPSYLEVDEKSALLNSDGHEKEPERGWCDAAKDGPSPACFKSVLLHERMKIFVILFFMLLAIFMFVYTPETVELCMLQLVAVSDDHPYSYQLSKTDKWLDVVEVAFDAPEKESDDYNITIIVTLEGGFKDGNGTNGTWLVLDEDDTWDVDLETYELSQEDNKHQFFVSDYDKDTFDIFRVHFITDSEEPIGLNLNVLELNFLVEAEVVIAAVILILVYVLIVFELVHRTIAAMIGSFIALSILSVVRFRPSLEVVITWIDFETIGLLFGMMIMVGIFSTTGFFEYSAIKAYKLAKGDLWMLTTYLCLFTAVVSAFLDNVTTVLLLTPVTIRLCKVIDVPAIPMLLAEVMYSNIGGTATAIGDPPNIIIVNDRRILKYDDEVNFGSFLIHVAPGVILTMIVVYFLIKWQTKPLLVRQPHEGLKQEIEVWERTLKRINPNSSEEDQKVYTMMVEHIASLKADMKNQQVHGVRPVDITELEKKYQIRDWTLFINSCCVLGTVIVFFFLHSAIAIDLSLAWIAIIGAMVHLVVAGIHDVDEVLEKVEFGTLLFFAGLFVLMRALEEMGLIEFIAKIVEELVAQVDGEQNQLAVAVLLILWVSAIFSAFIDNIPFTTTMVPVVVELHEGALQLPLGPLVWALSMGACFGGNGTLIGASANVVCVSVNCEFSFFSNIFSFSDDFIAGWSRRGRTNYDLLQ